MNTQPHGDTKVFMFDAVGCSQSMRVGVHVTCVWVFTLDANMQLLGIGIRHRTKRAKGCLNRDGMLHMMFKLGQCAEKRGIKLRGFDYLAKIITGVSFKDGIEVKTENQKAA